MTEQTHEFRAETRQLLDIVIHSLYSNKEIFLRELISNASDALDRRRFEGLTNEAIAPSETPLAIRLEVDPEARTLTVSDNGVGMRREEVVENIGTIAKSGTREIAAKLQTAEDPQAAAELIGQFGVGFYSAFMVADRVELVTRRVGEEEATRWTSDGDGSYTLDDAERAENGTDVILHLKPADAENGLPDFVDPGELRRVVRKHSDFVEYPVLLAEERQVPVETDDDAPDDDAAEDPETKAPEMRTVVEDATLNSMQPIWTRSQSEVTDEEYAEFYRHVSHDWQEPLDTLLLTAEGRMEYKALLFFPKKAPFDLFYRDQQYGLRLYVRRVLIDERAEELLPLYLRFLRGIVDSADLPLNVSREMVQHDRHLASMRKWLAKKVLDHLKSLRDDQPETYDTLWREFGRVLKEGIATDPENRDRLIPLLRFPSSHDAESETSIAEYVERMGEEQKAIYYAPGESRAAAESSPHLEMFREQGIEVLYFLDPVDEIVAQSLDEIDGKPLRSVAKGAVDLGDSDDEEAQEKREAQKSEYEGLLESLAKSLDEQVREVRLSRRLTTSPACLVAGESDLGPQLERLLRQNEGMDLPFQKRDLEVNPDHELLTKLRHRHEANADDPAIADAAYLLYGQALLAEGSELPDPARFARLMAEALARGL